MRASAHTFWLLRQKSLIYGERIRLGFLMIQNCLQVKGSAGVGLSGDVEGGSKRGIKVMVFLGWIWVFKLFDGQDNLALQHISFPLSVIWIKKTEPNLWRFRGSFTVHFQRISLLCSKIYVLSFWINIELGKRNPLVAF